MKISPISASSLSFSKNIINKTKIRTRNSQKADVAFVEYDPKDIRDRYQISQLPYFWAEEGLCGKTNSGYIFLIAENFEKRKNEDEFLPGKHFYGLEDDYENTLVIAEVTEKERFCGEEKNSAGAKRTKSAPEEQNAPAEDCKRRNGGADRGENRDRSADRGKYLHIDLIQADPDEAYNSRTKHFSGVGETLISQIVKKAKEDGKEAVELTSGNEFFWTSSGYFKPIGKETEDLDKKRLEEKDFDNYINFVESKKYPKKPYL